MVLTKLTEKSVWDLKWLIESSESRETIRKLCLYTKFPHQKIRWSYGIFRSEELLGTKKILLQGNNILQELGSQLHNMNLRVQRNWRENVINGTILESYWTLSCFKLRLYVVDFELDFILRNFTIFVRRFLEEDVITIGILWGSANIARMIPAGIYLFKVTSTLG